MSELHRGGTGFDCASSDEIRLVQSIGARSNSIIYANPCKSRNELFTAKTFNIQRMTFDSHSELIKITQEYNEAKPILRIFIDDMGASKVSLNKKFGFDIRNIDELLYRSPPFHIYGLAFHVGSDCTSAKAYESAFKTVREFLSVFRNYPSVFTPETLDIGGGFSGKQDLIFKKDIVPVIQRELKTLDFKEVIAEPGRFFAEKSCTFQVPVIGRKTHGKTRCLTIDDSVYGMFSGTLFDHFKPDFSCITRTPYSTMDTFTIFGRTCDSLDIIAKDVWLPTEIDDSDILEVKNIGAYSWVSSSEFNGFPKPAIVIRD